MTENDSTMIKARKPWYRRRRTWAAVVFLLLVYFCLIPSPLKISPETTGITQPLTPDGRPDYFGYYESTWIDKLSPPEDNGQRLTIAACGPRVLEQNHIAETVPWEEIATHENSKNWFENQWIPLCEHMYIDPYARPKFLDSLGFYGFLRLRQLAQAKPGEKPSWDSKESERIWNEFVAAPWKAEDHPEEAGWLEKRSPVLDLFGVAVRKPNFVCWRQRTDSMIAILLPDVQANRDFARDLRVRVTERLGRGDVDGAWYDVMSMFYLWRHYMKDPIYVVNLVGISIGSQGWEAAKIVLREGNPSAEQLERFANELATLSVNRTLNVDYENRVVYGILHCLEPGMLKKFHSDYGVRHSTLLYMLSYLPIDRNIAGKRLDELNTVELRTTNDRTWNINSTTLKKNSGLRDSFTYQKKEQLKSPFVWLRIPLIRTRSRLVADCLIDLFSPSYAPVGALDRATSQFDLLRIAIALERFQKETGDYPDDLEKLVPKYLDEVPLDPFTGRKTLTYKLKPEDGVPYIVYSYGANGVDDGGSESPMMNENDIVFKR